MATYYVDPDGGSDFNSPTQAQSTATPWKTLINLTNAGPSSVTLIAGDHVLCLGSTPFTRTGDTWAQDSSKVANIANPKWKLVSNLISTDTWTLSGGVSKAANTTYAHEVGLGSGTAFTVNSGITGMLGYHNLPTPLSATTFGAVGIQYKLLTSIAAYTGYSSMSITLHDGANAAGASSTFYFDNRGSVLFNKFFAFWGPASSLSAVSSISVNCSSSLHSSAVTFMLDNLVLFDMGTFSPDISHNDLVKDYSGVWRPIGAFGDDSVYVRGHNSGATDTSLVNPPATTVDIEYLKTYDWAVNNSLGGVAATFATISGTEASPILIEGGYLPGWVAPSGGSSTVWNSRGDRLGSFNLGNCSHVTFKNIGLVSINVINVTGTLTDCTFDNFIVVQTGGSCFSAVSSATIGFHGCTFNNTQFNYATGVAVSIVGTRLKIDNMKIANATTYGINPIGYLSNVFVNNSSFTNCNTSNIFLGSTSSRFVNERMVFKNCDVYNQATGKNRVLLNLPGGDSPAIVFDNWKDPTTATGGNNFAITYIASGFFLFRNIDVPTGIPVISPGTSTLTIEPRVVATFVGLAGDPDFIGYHMYPNFTVYKLTSPGTPYSGDTYYWEIKAAATMGLTTEASGAVYFRRGFYSVTAGVPVTFETQLLRNDTNTQTKLAISHTGGDGVWEDVEVSNTPIGGAADTWQTSTLTYTPSGDGNIELSIKVWNMLNANDYVRYSEKVIIT